MASYNKVYQFVQELAQGYFNLSTSGDTLMASRVARTGRPGQRGTLGGRPGS